MQKLIKAFGSRRPCADQPPSDTRENLAQPSDLAGCGDDRARLIAAKPAFTPRRSASRAAPLRYRSPFSVETAPNGVGAVPSDVVLATMRLLPKLRVTPEMPVALKLI